MSLPHSQRFLRALAGSLSGLAMGLAGTSAAVAQPSDSAVVDLPFSSFFRLPVGPRGLELSDVLRRVDGQRVRLTGYMVAREESSPGRFQIAPRPVRMSEHADGDADDLPPSTVTVLLDPGQADRVVLHQSGLLQLTGRLQVGRAEDRDGRVSWFRLRLDPHAMAASRSHPAGASAHGAP